MERENALLFLVFLLVLCEAAASQPQPYLKNHEAEAVRLTGSVFSDKASLWLHTEQAVLIVFVFLSKRDLYFFPFITNTSVPPRTMSEWLM